VRTAVLSEQAERDIDAIWVYIADRDFDAADRVRDEIKAEIQTLALHPGMGHSRQEIKDVRLRVWSIYSYLIVYRFDDHELVVVRVVHGARNIGAVFR
jgi:toxin ParE1/3/4